MSPKFAGLLVEMRLRQTAQLLEWMLQNVETDVAESVATALGAVLDAHHTIRATSLVAESTAG